MADKIKVVMIQGKDLLTRQVRINDGPAVDILNGGPVAGAGVMNFSMTLSNVEVSFESAPDPAAAQPAAGSTGT